MWTWRRWLLRRSRAWPDWETVREPGATHPGLSLITPCTAGPVDSAPGSLPAPTVAGALPPLAPVPPAEMHHQPQAETADRDRRHLRRHVPHDQLRPRVRVRITVPRGEQLHGD